MKQKKIWICLAVVVLAAIAVLGVRYLKKGKQEKKAEPVMGTLGLDCTVEKITHKEKKIYSDSYQAEVDNYLSEWKQKNDFSVENPLLVWNPYGTNTGSIYYYATTEEDRYAICEVIPKKGSVWKNRLKNEGANGMTKNHEYLIAGLSPGQQNRIKMSFYNSANQLVQEKTYTIQLKEDKKIPAITKVEKGESTAPLTEGLFAVLGHDKSTAKNIYYYDNDGVSRGRTPLEQYRTDRILTIDGNMVYSYRLSDLAIVNRLGRVIKTVNLGKYKLHHDFMYDETHKHLDTNKYSNVTISQHKLVHKNY